MVTRFWSRFYTTWWEAGLLAIIAATGATLAEAVRAVCWYVIGSSIAATVTIELIRQRHPATR